MIRPLLFAVSVLAFGWLLDHEIQWAKEPPRVKQPQHITPAKPFFFVEPQ
jgi:hypothetical protein